MTILIALARLLGPFLPFLAAWAAAKHEARLQAKNQGLEDVVEAMKTRERIDDEVSADPDLVARARRSVLRKPVK